MNNSGKNTEKLSITIDKTQHQQLVEMRKQEHISISGQVRQALKAYFAKYDKKGNR